MIIFVVHSLGGLVAECALSLSKSSPETDILLIEEHTVGIAFIGTPHHGSDYAAWIILASSLTNWLKRSNKNIVAVLKPDSEVLAGIQKSFQGLLARRRDVGKKISVTCFFEELPVTGVGEASATSNRLSNCDFQIANGTDCAQTLRDPSCIPSIWNSSQPYGKCHHHDVTPVSKSGTGVMLIK